MPTWYVQRQWQAIWCLNHQVRTTLAKDYDSWPAHLLVYSQLTKFMRPTWGPPGSCRSQMGPMLAPWTLLSGLALVDGTCWFRNNLGYLIWDFPLNTWRNNNVVITSKRRHFDVITSKWRRCDVITTSLSRDVFAGLGQFKSLLNCGLVTNVTFLKCIHSKCSPWRHYWRFICWYISDCTPLGVKVLGLFLARVKSSN